jgi:hypothetical protein
MRHARLVSEPRGAGWFGHRVMTLCEMTRVAPREPRRRLVMPRRGWLAGWVTTRAAAPVMAGGIGDPPAADQAMPAIDAEMVFI